MSTERHWMYLSVRMEESIHYRLTTVLIDNVAFDNIDSFDNGIV